MPTSVRIIGNGRAGGAFASALRDAGWRVDGPHGRDADTESALHGVDAVLLAVPDRAVADVAATLERGPAIVVHVSGSLGLDALAPHDRRASVHPLASLTDASTGADRLRGAWFAVAGEPWANSLVEALGGRAVAVADADRTAYHAAACVAANHLVALLGQVERIASGIGVPVDAFLDLAQGALDNVRARGTGPALTGPVARGDWDTVSAHVRVIDEAERGMYVVLADAARRLAVTTGAGR